MDTGMHSRESRRHAVALVLALVIYSLTLWLFTNRVFPLVITAAPFARETNALAQAAALFLLAGVATWYPRFLYGSVFTVLPAVLSTLGVAVMAVGIVLGPAGGAVYASLGLSLLSVSTGFALVVLGCAVSCLDRGLIAPCVLIAFSISYLLRFLAGSLQDVAIFAFLICAMPVVFCLVWPATRELIRDSRLGDAPSKLVVTNPFSFLPLNHQIFVCLLLFRIATGYALSFGEIDNLSPTTFAAFIPMVIFLGFYLVRRRLPDSDTLFHIAVLLVVAGYLFVPVSSGLDLSVTGNLLEAGSACFTLLFWVSLGVLAGRNRRGAIALFSWSGCILCLGVISGAWLGRLSNSLLAGSPLLAIVVNNLVVLGFISYTLVALKRFSFTATIEGLEESPIVVLPPDARGQRDDDIRALADDRGLTPREAEIFTLLARGRTGTFIQHELGVSYNTVKTHVGHIYRKFGLHNHQELIDYVEAHCASALTGDGSGTVLSRF